MEIKFRFDVYLHPVAPPSDPALAQILTIGKQTMSILQTLVARVAQVKEVSDSAVTLLNGLKTRLDEAIASGDPAVLQQLSDSLGVETQELADAVAANTPADPQPETPVEPGTPVDPDQTQG